MTLNAKIILSGLMLAIFGAMVATAFSYPAQAALVPLVIGVPGTVLCLIQLGVELRHARESTGAPAKQRDVRREWVMYGWIVGFVVTVTLLGFMLAAPIVLYSYLRFNAKESHWLSALIAVGGLALIWGVFEYTLGVDLFEGLLTPIVAGWLGLD
jgi:hypothetical protein